MDSARVGALAMRKTNGSYFKKLAADPTAFGGSLLKGNPSGKRPLDRDQAIHVTLRSEVARGAMHLQRHNPEILRALERLARKFKITVYLFANSGNHFHLLARPPKRAANFANFLRAFAGVTARIATGAERGSPKKIKFWALRPWSRLVRFGKPFRVVRNYVALNIVESWGMEAVAEMEAWLLGWREKPT